MSYEGVSLPLIHDHLMTPWNDLRKGNCCEGLEATSDGYFCKICDIFVHKKCGESSELIEHPSHSSHTLQLQRDDYHRCDLCGRDILEIFYHCGVCDFDVDLYCLNYPPPDVIDSFDTHSHTLTILKERIKFECSSKCGMVGYGFPYQCHECDLSFHVNCVWHPSEEVKRKPEVNHSYHSMHQLKLLIGEPPEYSDGKCRLCGSKVDRLFYHCSSCNFTLDMRCVLNPPPKSHLGARIHDHELTLLPRLISFTCNACGLNGDRSPYMCVQCDFVIHKDCLGLPRLININRHDHRVSLIPLIGVVNSVCRICRRKMDWICGGYSCQICTGYFVHSKCATRKDVWNGKELEGVPEEVYDIEPYVVIDEKTIQHFSHKEHNLRLNVDCLIYDESKRCCACTHPVCLQTFYQCRDCDFCLHQKCAELFKRKWHVLHNEELTLVTSKSNLCWCDACSRQSNGFAYEQDNKQIDVLCGSISEPFVHPSHPLHPLYHIPQDKPEVCNVCNKENYYVLRCIEDSCKFAMDFRCATLPKMVKHRVDDYPLSLCYGEKASGKYWCDICEKETDPKTWFYTSKDHRDSLHINCVLGDFIGLMPGSIIDYSNESFEVVLNNSINRPFCSGCIARCMYPIILKLLGNSDTCFCSIHCRWSFKKRVNIIKEQDV